MKSIILLGGIAVLLTGCVTRSPADNGYIDVPSDWATKRADAAKVQDLQDWWMHFDDPTLDRLVERGLENSPQKNIAEARILEARGLQKYGRSALFPSIDASADKGRGKGLFGGATDFYDVGFDAAFELDLFGKNRSAAAAGDALVDVAEAEYYDVSLSLVADISRAYIDYRAGQWQAQIAQDNVNLQAQALGIAKKLYEFGEITQVDLLKAEVQVETTRATVSTYEQQAENARLRLTVLTGDLPAKVVRGMEQVTLVPLPDVRPALRAPSEVLARRPDVRAAKANLQRQTKLADAAFADLFPTLSLNGFFGISDGVLVSSQAIWEIAANAAVSLIDFGKVEGQIDAAKAVEKQAFEAYRLATLKAIAEVETALGDYGHIGKQQIALQEAYRNADKAFQLSKMLYGEGEIPFVDLLEAQQQKNAAEAGMVNARAAKAESLIRIYKSLGVY